MKNHTNLIAEIVKNIAQIEGNKFVAFTYLAKKSNELARHTVQVGFDYGRVIADSVTELELMMVENETKWTELQKQAAANVMASLKETQEKHAKGEQNSAYTKKGQYIPLGHGLNLNSTDNSLQLFCLAHNKTVIVEGNFPLVNSRPLTIAQNQIKKQLPISKVREFALDLSQVAGCRINGQTLEMEQPAR